MTVRNVSTVEKPMEFASRIRTNFTAEFDGLVESVERFVEFETWWIFIRSTDDRKEKIEQSRINRVNNVSQQNTNKLRFSVGRIEKRIRLKFDQTDGSDDLH